MALWGAAAPDITKDRKVSYGNTAYSHASLPNVTKSVNDTMSPFGLKSSWRTEQPEGKVKVTCIVSHTLGHSESTSLTAAADDSGSKNAIQAMGSTISYLERYTLLAITGLAAHDMDDDGKATSSSKEPEFITKAQVKTIEKRLKEIYGDDPSMFFTWIEAETVDTITDYAKAKKGLDGAEAAKAKAKKAEREPGEEG
jgi:hypothetical protein